MIRAALHFARSSLNILIEPTVGRPGSLVGRLLRRVGIWLPILFFHLALVWNFGSNFGLPQLIWRVEEDPLASFLGSSMIGMFLGLGVFLFFVLDYSEWLGERRAFRRHVAEKMKVTEANQINNGPDHWSNPFYRSFKAKGGGNPNQKLDVMADFQSYLFHHLFTLAVLLWSALWLLQPLVSRLFDLPMVHQLPGEEKVEVPAHWWLVPLGFAIGIGGVCILDWVNRFVYDRSDWLRTRSQRLARYLQAGRREQEVSGTYDEGPLLGFFILSCLSVFFMHLFFFLLDGLGEEVPIHFPVVALCIFAAELMLLYTGASLVFRRKGIEIWGIACALFVGLIQRGSGTVIDQMDGWLAGPLLGPIVFLLWLTPVAVLLLFFRKGLEVWLLGLSLILIGLLPYTGHRYLFKHLEGDGESNPGKSFEDLAHLGEHDAPGREPVAVQEHLYLEPGVPSWAERAEPLVIVCASGGGITAEVWAFKMLHLLDRELPDFAPNLRVITGASGGMVGAASWVAGKSEGNSRNPRYVFSNHNLDQLSRVTQRLALWDLSWGAVFQRINVWPLKGTEYWDRGNLLEDVWQDKFPELKLSLADLRPREMAGEVPSLVFSPMLAQDGRRLLASNLDLTTLKHAGWGQADSRNRVRSAIQGGPETLSGVPLTTWARMGATFPIVSPAASLPQRDRKHVTRNAVDAGYYDNGGANLAVGWLRECYLPWLGQEYARPGSRVRAPTSIILVELDAYPRLAGAPERRRLMGNLFFEDFKQVLRGASKRVRTMHFRNDEEIEALGRFAGNHELLKHIPIHCVRFECNSGTSLSWALTARERKAIFDCADSNLDGGGSEEFSNLKSLLGN